MAFPGAQTKRLRRCPCGAPDRISVERWEVVAQRLPVVTRNSPATHPQPPGNSPATTGNRSHVRASESEVCVSGSEVSSSLEDQSQNQTRVSTEYPSAFEAEWNQTTKTGAKFAALKAWKALGKPAFGAAWAKWSTLDGWRRGFVPHVSTWLNDRRFEQEPIEVVRKAPEPRRVTTFAVAAEERRRDEAAAEAAESAFAQARRW